MTICVCPLALSMIVMYTQFMNTSIEKMAKSGKKIGRPVSTGAATIPPRSVRLPGQMWKDIDNWRRHYSGDAVPSRNDAIRQLLAIALRTKQQ